MLVEPLIHRRATPMSGEPAAQWFATRFAVNGWSGSWRGGLYDWHHYHLNSHEVLGVISGAANLQFSGPNGAVELLTAGDVVVIPAGCAHCLLAASEDFEVIGATPGGVAADLHQGMGAFAASPLPARADPVLGPGQGFALR